MVRCFGWEDTDTREILSHSPSDEVFLFSFQNRMICFRCFCPSSSLIFCMRYRNSFTKLHISFCSIALNCTERKNLNFKMPKKVDINYHIPISRAGITSGPGMPGDHFWPGNHFRSRDALEIISGPGMLQRSFLVRERSGEQFPVRRWSENLSGPF